jgi:glyoxylase-like metal-dependent hydrolase (beta-lactamase superfamily II)
MRGAVHRISIPNPFFEGRNSVYVIVSDPVTLIDTGIATDKAFQTLKSGLAAHGISISDVRRVILTHKHIDHIGNAWRIQGERTDEIEILAHESECGAVEDVDPLGERFYQLVSQRLREWNAPESSQPVFSPSAMPAWELEPAVAKGLVDGQQIDLADGQLEVIHTPGHTMGSICLSYGPYLFTGDHVLGDISPNVGAGEMRRNGMLEHFFASLERVQNMTDVVDVMPGHGKPFSKLRQRCRELVNHHEERLDKTVDILRNEPRSVYEVACELFGQLADFHIVLGCAEANAHLEFLVDQCQVARDDGKFRLI